MAWIMGFSRRSTLALAPAILVVASCLAQDQLPDSAVESPATAIDSEPDGLSDSGASADGLVLEVADHDVTPTRVVDASNDSSNASIPRQAEAGVTDASGEGGAPVDVQPSTTPLDRLRAAAEELLVEGDAAAWGRDGVLTTDHLSNPMVTTGLEGVEAFNVLDSDGYEGDYKCNLLAFELAFRAGLMVPVMGRGRGWGYPGPGMVVHQIVRGRLVEQWARRVDSTDLEELQRLSEGGAVLMIAGEGPPGRPGHVGIVERVHQIEIDGTGHLSRVEYTGWEANPDGGNRRRRTWRIGRYLSIHFLELRDPPRGEPQVVPMGFGPIRASLHDAIRHCPECLTVGRGRDGESLDRARGLPELPVAHSVLGGDSNWGAVVNVRDIARSTVTGEAREVSESESTSVAADERLEEVFRRIRIHGVPAADGARTLPQVPSPDHRE